MSVILYYLAMKRMVICYWGLTRSTRKVYQTHIDKIFTILKNNNIEFDIFMHTWKTNENYIWEHKSNTPIDYEEYKLLSPMHYNIDDQDEFLNSIKFSDYFDAELYKRYGGDTHHEWRPALIRNHLCALESQKRVTDMVLQNDKQYDYIMYIRPDVMIKNDFTPFYISNAD